MAKQKEVLLTALEDINAGDHVIVFGDDNIRLDPENGEGVLSFQCPQKVKAGKKIKVPVELIPVLRDTNPDDAPPDNATPEIEDKKPVKILTPSELPCVVEKVAEGFTFLGTDGKGSYYFGNDNGAYTMNPQGKFLQVGRRFGEKFIESLKR